MRSDRGVHFLDKLVDIERLAQELRHQALPHRRGDSDLIKLRRYEHDGGLVPMGIVAKQLEQLESRDAWQVHVHHQHFNVDVTEYLARSCGVVDDRRTPAHLIIEHSAEQLGDRDIILDYEDRQRFAIGTFGHGSLPATSLASDTQLPFLDLEDR